MRTWLICVLFALASAQVVHAADIQGYPADVRAYDPREVAMLPEYCRYTQNFRDHLPGANNAAAIQRWSATLGQIFEAMHHWCWGLMKSNRALFLARDNRTKTFYLRDSIDEFDYVILRAPRDFILLPEMLTKKGENLLRLGNGPVGAAALEMAIELKADYFPAYAALSDYHKEKGDVATARKILEKGIALAPEARALRRRMDALPAASSADAARGR